MEFSFLEKIGSTVPLIFGQHHQAQFNKLIQPTYYVIFSSWNRQSNTKLPYQEIFSNNEFGNKSNAYIQLKVILTQYMLDMLKTLFS